MTKETTAMGEEDTIPQTTMSETVEIDVEGVIVVLPERDVEYAICMAARAEHWDAVSFYCKRLTRVDAILLQLLAADDQPEALRILCDTREVSKDAVLEGDYCALWKAVCINSFDILEFLCTYFKITAADYETLSSKKECLFRSAVRHADIKVFTFLHELFGKELSDVDYILYNIYKDAVMLGKLDIVKYMHTTDVDRFNINAIDADNCFALYCSVKEGHSDVAKYICSIYANAGDAFLDAYKKYDAYAAFTLACRSGELEMMKLIHVETKIEPTRFWVEPDYGERTLQKAVEASHLGVVRYLWVNFGKDPLMQVAVMHPKMKILEFLYDHKLLSHACINDALLHYTIALGKVDKLNFFCEKLGVSRTRVSAAIDLQQGSLLTLNWDASEDEASRKRKRDA